MDNTQTRTGLITVMATVQDIKNGKFLVGRFDVDNENLTQVLLSNNATAIPPANEHATYRLIATDPLDQYVEQYVTGWNGTSDITLFFNAEGILDHWAASAMAKGAA